MASVVFCTCRYLHVLNLLSQVCTNLSAHTCQGLLLMADQIGIGLPSVVSNAEAASIHLRVPAPLPNTFCSLPKITSSTLQDGTCPYKGCKDPGPPDSFGQCRTPSRRDHLARHAINNSNTADHPIRFGHRLTIPPVSFLTLVHLHFRFLILGLLTLTTGRGTDLLVSIQSVGQSARGCFP